MKLFPPLFLVVALFVNISCVDSGIHFFETRDKILFDVRRNGTSQLYIMSHDGSALEQITFAPYGHSNGRWSPDRKKIVCNTTERQTSEVPEMVVIEVNGSQRIFLGRGTQMSWTPDGTRIVFLSYTVVGGSIGNTGLYIVNADGSNRHLLTEEFGGEAAFSPDGSLIAFSLGDSTSSPAGPIITMMQFPGFGNRRPVGPQYAYGPSWSPDGREFAYVKSPPGVINNEIMAVDTATQTEHLVSIQNTNEWYNVPRWSRDGKMVAFVGISATGGRTLYVANRDGSLVTPIFSDPSLSSIHW